MYRLLIIDDEEMILNMLKCYFESEGYIVETAKDADGALSKLSSLPDLILLDINMPGINGLELCKVIRQHIFVPIVFLTARGTEKDKIDGFMAGGDDYITKPFSMAELHARIKAHLRREGRSKKRTKVIFDGGLFIDYGGKAVFYEDSNIELSNKEFDIIELLSANAGQVFNKERIYESIWGIEGAGDSNVIKEHIRKIRLKLSKYTEKEYLETVWGAGYRWKK